MGHCRLTIYQEYWAQSPPWEPRLVEVSRARRRPEYFWLKGTASVSWASLCQVLAAVR